VVGESVLITGPGRATGTGRLLLEACRGRLPFLVDTAFSVVDIDDCAKGHLLAAQHGIPGERYILSGATTNTREAMAMLQRITGRAVRPRYLRLVL
jgi:dihydroflavonol-4-reductase